MPQTREDAVLTSAQRFAALAERMREDETYKVEAAKHRISTRIEDLMRERDINKAELARRLGKSRAYISKLLRGGENLTIESLVRIGQVLGCELELDFAAQSDEATCPVSATPSLVMMAGGSVRLEGAPPMNIPWRNREEQETGGHRRRAVAFASQRSSGASVSERFEPPEAAAANSPAPIPNTLLAA